jgi:hypothetical protein
MNDNVLSFTIPSPIREQGKSLNPEVPICDSHLFDANKFRRYRYRLHSPSERKIGFDHLIFEALGSSLAGRKA